VWWWGCCLVLAVVVVGVVAVTGAKAGKERDWDRDRQAEASNVGGTRA